MISSVVAVGAHPDDIELGCGATLWRHARAGTRVVMLVMTNGLMGPGKVRVRRREAREAADELEADLRLAGFSDGTLGDDVKTVKAIERVLTDVQPGIIYTHAEDDSHQDHRATASAVLAAARNFPTILHYQSPSTRRFNPEVFVGVGAEDMRHKLDSLARHATQVKGSAKVDLDAVASTARYWGTKMHVDYAEGYEITRALLGVQPDGRKVEWPSA